jgi:hypothetical protein
MNVYTLPPNSKLAYFFALLKQFNPHLIFEKLTDGIRWRRTKFARWLFKRNIEDSFNYQGQTLAYNQSNYNNTSCNERHIEISLANYYLKEFKATKILELGAVLVHYQPISWDVIDKFERGDNIIKQDIIDYFPSPKYNLCLSISTLEHIGMDDDFVDPNKIQSVITHLKKHVLKPQGKAIFTFPLGYNPYLDKFVYSNSPLFDRLEFFQRLDWSNNWQLMTDKPNKKVRYNHPFNNANVLGIGFID